MAASPTGEDGARSCRRRPMRPPTNDTPGRSWLGRARIVSARQLSGRCAPLPHACSDTSECQLRKRQREENDLDVKSGGLPPPEAADIGQAAESALEAPMPILHRMSRPSPGLPSTSYRAGSRHFFSPCHFFHTGSPRPMLLSAAHYHDVVSVLDLEKHEHDDGHDCRPLLPQLCPAGTNPTARRQSNYADARQGNQ